eukprot:774604_1
MTKMSSEKEESKTIWKIDKVPINDKASKQTYNKIICHWIRTHYDANIKLSNDIINFIAEYLSISISYSTKWSNKYKSDCIEVRDNGNSFVLKNDIDQLSFAVIKCENELKHGMITEYKLKLRADHMYDYYNTFCIGIVNDKFDNYGLHDKKGKNIGNFWGFMDKGEPRSMWIMDSYPAYNIYDCYLASQAQGYLGYEGMCFSSQISSHMFSEITVRVNLKDYILSFWHVNQYHDNAVCLINRTLRPDWSGGGSVMSMRGGMINQYLPIVIDLPKDKSFKWYPALFINYKQATPISLQFVE